MNAITTQQQQFLDNFKLDIDPNALKKYGILLNDKVYTYWATDIHQAIKLTGKFNKKYGTKGWFLLTDDIFSDKYINKERIVLPRKYFY